MTSYRKLFEPRYGDPVPEAIIDAPQVMDLEHPQRSRTQIETASVIELGLAWSKCNCYPRLMGVDVARSVITVRGGVIPVRVYKPDSTTEPAPVVVFIHGGGFSMNNADVYDQLYRYLAAYERVLVVAPDYRLAPEHTFPTPVEDCYAALLWSVESCREFGGDPLRLVVAGDSAGGNISAALTLMSRERRGPAISAQILIYPVTDFRPEARSESEERYGKGYFLEYDSRTSPLSYYFATPEAALSPLASPILEEDLGGLPPALVVSAECDPLLDQALRYAARLEDAGVPLVHSLKEGMVHGFINRPYRQSFEAFGEIGEFVRD